MKETIRDYVVCPKCKSIELEFTEISEAKETWQQDAQGNIVQIGDGAILSPNALRVEASCLNGDCGHKWTVRRVSNITELPNWPREEVEEEVSEKEGFALEEEAEEVAETTTEEATEAETEVEEETPKKKKRGRPAKKAA